MKTDEEREDCIKCGQYVEDSDGNPIECDCCPYECHVSIDDDCTGIATHTVDDGYSIIKCCLPCADHTNSHSIIESIEGGE